MSDLLEFAFLEFQTEINYLGQLHHPNLVKLVGYCLEDEHRLLVYEFMPRGSLENHLFRSKLVVDLVQAVGMFYYKALLFNLAF